MCFNPLVSLPDANFIREALEKLEFFGVVDFFLSETAHHADVVLAGSLQEEDEGMVAAPKAGSCTSRRPSTARRRARPTGRSLSSWRGGSGKGQCFPFHLAARDLRRAARGLAGAASPTTTASPTRRSSAQQGVFWPCPSLDHPGTPRLFEGGRFLHPDGKARFIVAEYRPERRPLRRRFPLYLTTGRVVSQYLSGTQTRRIGPLVDQYPEPRVEIASRSSPSRYGIKQTATG